MRPKRRGRCRAIEDRSQDFLHRGIHIVMLAPRRSFDKGTPGLESLAGRPADDDCTKTLRFSTPNPERLGIESRHEVEPIELRGGQNIVIQP